MNRLAKLPIPCAVTFTKDTTTHHPNRFKSDSSGYCIGTGWLTAFCNDPVRRHPSAETSSGVSDGRGLRAKRVNCLTSKNNG